MLSIYVYEICKGIRKSATNVLGPHITNAVVSSAVLVCCIALEIW